LFTPRVRLAICAGPSTAFTVRYRVRRLAIRLRATFCLLTCNHVVTLNLRCRRRRRTLLGWSCLFHLGRDAWCLRIFVAGSCRTPPVGECVCTPSVLAPHLAARRRRLPHGIATCLPGVFVPFDARARLRLPRHGSQTASRPATRTSLVAKRCPRDPVSGTSRVRRPRCKSPCNLVVLPFLAVLPACAALALGPARPLRASPASPVGLVPSQRHPWGFPFRGLTVS